MAKKTAKKKRSRKKVPPAGPKQQAARVGVFSQAMGALVEPIGGLVPDPENARTHSGRNIEVIAASLGKFGQQTPVVASREGVVMKGSGTLAAARSLGWSHLAVVRTDLTGDKLRAYAIADNRSGDAEVGSAWDDEQLKQTLDDMALLEELDGEAFGLEDVGFNDDELEALALLVDSQGPSAEADSAGSGSGSGEGGLDSIYQVVVDCADEREQQRVYERLKADKLKPRLMTMHRE
ncbi:MAG: hypothetical protein ACPGYV_12390 [Phycisphaeraceae bacterium]